MSFKARPCFRVLLAFLCLVGLVSTSQAAQGKSDIDIVFLVDTSKEMEANDASRGRLSVLHAIIDLTRGLGTQRVAVMGLSRDETERMQLPLTLLPESLEGARAVVDAQLSPVVEGLRSDGDGLTILDSFEALGQRLGNRGGTDPHLWVVLLTNGDADPLGSRGDPGAVNPAIQARAQELADDEGALRINREHFKKAAKEKLPADVPPILSRLGETTLTVINVGATADDRRGVLEPLAARTSGTQVLDLADDNVRQVAVDAIAQAPFPPRSSRTLTSDLSGAETQRLRIYQGTKAARVLVSAAHADFDARLMMVGGKGAINTATGTGPVRSLWLTDPSPAPGEYELTIENRGGSLGLEARLEFELELHAKVAPPAGGMQAVGSSLELGFQLTDFAGQVVSDPFLIEDGRVTLSWTDPSGNPPKVAWDLTGDDPLERTFTYTPKDSSEGSREYGWTIEAGLLPGAGGTFGWNLKPETGSVGFDFSMPRLSLSLVDSEGSVDFEPAGAGGALSFSTDYLSGSVTQTATLKLGVDLLGMAEVPVSLSFEPGDDASSGRTASKLLIDGQPIGAGTTIPYTQSTGGSISVEVTKSGFGPFSGDVGSLVAVVASGDPVEVPVSMGAHLGMMTLLAVAALIVLLVLAYLALKKMGRRRAWLALLDGLDDDAVLYFEDDEKGAA